MIGVDFGSGVDFSPTWALNDPMHITAELDLVNNTYTLSSDNSFHSNTVFADARPDDLAGFDFIVFLDTGGLGGALQTFEVGIDNFIYAGSTRSPRNWIFSRALNSKVSTGYLSAEVHDESVAGRNLDPHGRPRHQGREHDDVA